MEEKQINFTCIKLGLLGDSAVGKYSVCNAFINNEFGNYIAIIGVEKFETKFTLENGKKIKLVLWTTAGQERFRSSTLKAVKAVQGIILVFNFNDRQSFRNLDNWLEEIKENLNNNIIVVLFGNKIDTEKEGWQVTSEEAKEYAKKKNLVLFETSAKTKQGIKEGITYIVNKAYLIAEKRMGKEFIKSQKLNKLLKYINL